MSRATRLAMGGACLGVALLAALAAALGVFARGDGAFVTVTSARGDVYDMATTGVYAWSGKQLVAEGVGWDVFTLMVVAPVLALAAWWVVRGSFRGRLLALGLLGYCLYQYLEYTLTWAFGPLFLLHIVIYGLSLIGIVVIAASLFQDRSPQETGSGFPYRGWAVLSVGMSALLTLMWLRRITAGLSGDPSIGALDGETTMVVQALDLGLVVPSLILSAILGLRRSLVGRVLAAVMCVAFMTMATAIACMLVSAGFVHGTLEIPPLAIFCVAAMAAGILSIRMFRSMGLASGSGVASHQVSRPSPIPAMNH